MKCTTADIQAVRFLLERIPYVTLATADAAGNPWNSPVSAVYSPQGAIYWFSDRMAQHSRNVRATGRVFLVIYDSTWPEGTGAKGLYVQAYAQEVTDLQEIVVARLLKKRAHGATAKGFTGRAVRRVYKAIPERAWINAVQRRGGRFVRDYRREIPLSALKTVLAPKAP